MMHALAGRQAVGFDHDGWMEDLDGFLQLRGRGADGIVGGGNVVALQEALGKALAGFKHGGAARWPEDAESPLLQGIDNAQREGQLRADDGEAGLFRLGEADHGVEVSSDPRERSGPSARCRRCRVRKPLL